MKRLLLIAPLAADSLLGQGFYFRMPGLGLLKVAALTPPDWHVTITDEKVERLDLDADADLVGITSMTATVQRGYELARHFRNRGCKVVMGGMHVSALPEEAREHCDSVVIGEAEGVWPEVLRDFERGALQPVYRQGADLPPLGGLPRADWNLYRPKGYLPVHFVETSRGCPIGCDFCAVTSAFGGRLRHRPIDDVIAELKALVPFKGLFVFKRAVFFVDDNIAGDRAYARQLLERVAELRIRWFGQASINIAKDPELLRRCQQSGCVGLFIGLETLSPETLAAVGKRVNRPQDYSEACRRIHDHGIGIDASFVFGFDTDDDGVFDKTLEFVMQTKIEVAYFSILTPYPGTRFHRRMVEEDRLLPTDWSKYDGNHVVFRPTPYTAERLQDGFDTALRELYRVPSILRRLWGTPANRSFFYSMNFGFRRSVQQQQRAARRSAAAPPR